jgi:putative flavoprotein involved in K+ transport
METSMTDSSPSAIATAWLAEMDRALQAGDAAAAAALFNDESYWRDMVSFTWNIATAEGRPKVQEMIEKAVLPARPSGWTLDEPATEAGGVTEAWIRFETAVARGYGHLRLTGGKCWTLLTTMTELKGFEEATGLTRDRGVVHGADPSRKTWLEQRAQEEAELGYSKQPYCLIVGGGQGGIGLGARRWGGGGGGAGRAAPPGCAAWASPRSSSRRTPGQVIPGAGATRACACTTRCGTTTCPTCPFPITGRCSRPRTRSATGWRCTPR